MGGFDRRREGLGAECDGGLPPRSCFSATRKRFGLISDANIDPKYPVIRLSSDGVCAPTPLGGVVTHEVEWESPS